MSRTAKLYPRLQDTLYKPVDPGSLALFRMLFGIILAYFAYKEADPQLIYAKYVLPDVHFTYLLFDLLGFKPLPFEQLQLITRLMGISATFIALGFLTNFALSVFIVSFSYLFLLEKAFYNNHYYLIILLAFLLVFMRSGRVMSLDALRKPAGPAPKIPFWNIFLLRAQICIVYFFAGLVKFNPDYLSGRYMSEWIVAHDKLPLLSALLPSGALVALLTFAGLIFDLLIGFFLCYRPTRYAAFFAAIVFHLLNWLMFPQIGIFPSFMIATLVLFIEPDQMTAIRQRIGSLFRWEKSSELISSEAPKSASGGPRNNLTMGLIMLYLLIQVLVPLRHWFIPGNALWTQEGNRFSWRVMSSIVEGRMSIRVLEPSTQRKLAIDPLEDMTPAQYVDMAYTPDMIYQYVQFLKRKLKAQGIKDPAIYVDSQISINGRPYRPYIDPEINLAEKEYSILQAADWILPPPEDF